MAKMRGRFERRTWEADPAVHAPPRYRRGCFYDAFIPEPIAGFEPSITAPVAAAIAEAEAAQIRLDARHDPALGPLSRLLLRSESIASSKIEGLSIPSSALLRAEAGRDAGQRVGPLAEEVLGNLDAMELALDRAATEAVTPGTLTAIHAALLARAPNARIAGAVRTQQNWIGGNDWNPCGATFVPPPPEYVDDLLQDLSAFCEVDVLSPVTAAAIAHAQFETIHPFADGNGRTGRALIHVVLGRRGLATRFAPPISIRFASDKAGYIKGLTAFRDGGLDPWLERFAADVVHATSIAHRYLDSVSELRERWRERLSQTSSPRSDSAAWLLVDQLPAHPVLTLGVAMAATRRSKGAILGALDALVEAGVLSPVGDAKRYRRFEATELLDLLDELDA